MLVSDLFTRLSYGPFSNLSIGMDGSGTIADATKPKIITHLNDALTQLYSRFVLSEDDLLINQDDGIRYYHLTPEFAASNVDAPLGQVQYIVDTPEDPFTGNVIKVLVVRDQYGREMDLNDPTGSNPIYTPQPLLLQVPSPELDAPLGVVYQASHPLIGISDYAAKISVPRVLEPALISHIAYQVYSNMNSSESSAKASEHLSIYESVCSSIEDKDLVNNTYSMSNVRFEKRGWV